MVASLVTCQNLMVILARFWSGHHGQILHGSITSDLSQPYGNLGKILVRVTMAKSCLVVSLVTCQNLMVILARFWSGHHGQILPGSITSDLSEPYGNLGKILVRSPWPNILPGSITSDLSEPYGNLGKILLRSPWPNSWMSEHLQ